MKRIGIREARQALPQLVDQAEAGEEIIITRQGRPVARLVAAPRASRALPALADFRAGLGTEGTPAVRLLREERNARG
jgi:prevent-host-death family protein